jgi:hypothetical protein
LRRHGLDIADVRRKDFPLPTLGPVLERLRAEVLDGSGFMLLRGMPVEGRSIAESATAYWGIGTYFGNARSQNAKGHLLGHVYDLGLGLSATNPNLRSYATAERQNFHIDRCDVVALLCLRRAKSGGPSTIVSSMAVHNAMAARRPDVSRHQTGVMTLRVHSATQVMPTQASIPIRHGMFARRVSTWSRDHLYRTHDRATPVEAHDMKRVLADVDAHRGNGQT